MTDSSAFKSGKEDGGSTAGELDETRFLLGVFIDLCEGLADECDADLSESFLKINAAGPDGTRELAKVSIAELIERHRTLRSGQGRRSRMKHNQEVNSND